MRYTSPFQPSKLFSQQGGTKEKTGHPRSRSTPRLNCIKISKETGKPTQLKRAHGQTVGHALQNGVQYHPSESVSQGDFIYFLWALSRRLVAQEETSNRHQCWSDLLTNDRHAPKPVSMLPPNWLTCRPSRISTCLLIPETDYHRDQHRLLHCCCDSSARELLWHS